MWFMLSSNSWASCLSLQRTGITGLHHNRLLKVASVLSFGVWVEGGEEAEVRCLPTQLARFGTEVPEQWILVLSQQMSGIFRVFLRTC
jgi:hypothetical protein